MAIESRNILKTYFETGKVPTENQFADLIDSYIHRIDDGVYIFDTATGEKRFGIGIQEPPYPLGIQSQGASEDLISLHDSSHAALWKINMLPTGAPDLGLNIAQQTAAGDETRLFINASSGNIGLGTLEPEEKLHIEKSTSSDITGLKFLNTASVGNQGWRMGHLQDAITERDGALSIIESDSDEERMIIRAGGKVGINEAIPDVKLHVSMPASDPEAVISLAEGTGIMMVGPITDNVAFDFEGIQARHGEYIGPTLDLETATLNLQKLGGDILIHGDGSITEDNKTILTNDSKLGLGIIEPQEKLDVNGAIRIADATNANEGTIRWTGSDFEGRTASNWVSLTQGNGPWSIGADDSIYYSNGVTPRVGIGTSSVPATLSVSDQESTTSSNIAVAITNRSTTTSTGQDDNRVGVLIRSGGTWGGDPLSKNIGVYVADISGQPNDRSNISALLNGNVVIGDRAAGKYIVGDRGSRVLVIQNGIIPAGIADEKSVQLYSTDIAGNPTLHVMDGSGNIIKIYKETALTPGDDTPFSTTYDSSVILLLDKMRDRINELEAKLQAIGLIA